MDSRTEVRYGWQTYSAAVALVVVAATLRVLALQALGIRSPWLTFYPAVMLAALYGGFPAGALAAFLSCLTVVFILPAFAHQAVIRDPADWLGLCVFLATSAIVAAFVEAFRRAAAREKLAQQDIRRLNAALERRVRERTAQLEQANTALRNDEARLRTVFDHLSEGIVVSDLNGELLHLNGAAMKMHGFTDRLEYLRALPEFADTFEVEGLDGAVWPVDQWPLARILRGETLRDLEISVRHVGAGWQRFFSYSGGRILDDDGQPVLALVTVREVTERTRVRQAS